MTFKDLNKIIRKQTEEQQTLETTTDPIQKELEESRALMRQLRTNFVIAYQRRRDKWFEEHAGEKYFNETYEDFVNDCEVDEWFWYFIERTTSRTPEQRYQDEKFPTYGWNHLSRVHSVDQPCREGCRFWPETGRIEDIEILEDYKEYQDY
jgi:hypothetical protein